MANIKSAKKRVKQTIKKTARNKARRSSIKTAVKKVMIALEESQDAATLKTLFQDAESKIARAKGKGIFHANTAARKVGRLAKRIASAGK